MPPEQPGSLPARNASSDRLRIVVATSVMLTFISYWRAAAIVSMTWLLPRSTRAASPSRPLANQRPG